jgi:hypothetical protein
MQKAVLDDTLETAALETVKSGNKTIRQYRKKCGIRYNTLYDRLKSKHAMTFLAGRWNMDGITFPRKLLLLIFLDLQILRSWKQQVLRKPWSVL